MQKKRSQCLSWEIPEDWPVIHTIDAHTAGEPLRVIIAGLPDLEGKTILERRYYIKEQFDYFRTALMWEPRGHADMYGAILTPPVSKEADFGVLFLHNEGYSTMCGHGIIAVTKVVLETGMLKKTEPETTLHIDTPAGLVRASARISNGRVETVCFDNVPSFAVAMDHTITIPGIGTLRYDIAFGGAFYAFVSAEELGLSLGTGSYATLIDTGMRIKRALMESYPVKHPFEPDLNFLYGTIFTGKPESPDVHSRNVCIFAEGEVDRSPTGTGVSARLALHYARGEIGLTQPIVIESIIGSRFTGSVIEETRFGEYDAIIPRIEGKAFITGEHRFVIDPDDDLSHGFLLR
jgi:trans-L-3-hydroxyproline dehydratase